MTLSQRQMIFAYNLGKLLMYCFANGFNITMGEVHRTDEQHQLNLKRGITKATRSLHQDRLAFDCNLFLDKNKDGKLDYCTETKDYEPLGKYWCSLHPHNRWGGDWDKDGQYTDEKFSDGNHFEMQIINE